MKLVTRLMKSWGHLYVLFFLIFLLGVVSGVFFHPEDNHHFQPVSANYMDIFINNLKVGLLLIFGGLMSGGVIPILVIGSNGYIIGHVIHIALTEHTITLLFTGLLPHMFVELVALISCAVVGSFSGSFMFNYFRNKVPKNFFRLTLSDGLTLFFIAFFLLFLASLIEDFISHVKL
ncbi:stage II sporulation protein M [Neobacillus thermocopriae]|uniref:Stage II sporulation protein M n=1 Tax=Neobacillus thermocopriae TaxID=1215031 RepID=A0A6B3TSN2_9BACI|nr:stage II sporulation protein M [Neobacillus thermocopriae]MED3623385.1 stage II sporulation protein M [Neobacillus thermocopriae]MED3713964.1 stage II sporulation protein M [Neobacillus thermocopriae]NEX79346.1 stage II sporulation protein M [Neobacillus thermocopriae]